MIFELQSTSYQKRYDNMDRDHTGTCYYYYCSINTQQLKHSCTLLSAQKNKIVLLYYIIYTKYTYYNIIYNMYNTNHEYIQQSTYHTEVKPGTYILVGKHSSSRLLL